MSDQDLYSLVSKDSQSDVLASLPEEPTKKHSSTRTKRRDTIKKTTSKKTVKRESPTWNKYSLKRIQFILIEFLKIDVIIFN